MHENLNPFQIHFYSKKGTKSGEKFEFDAFQNRKLQLNRFLLLIFKLKFSTEASVKEKFESTSNLYGY